MAMAMSPWDIPELRPPRTDWRILNQCCSSDSPLPAETASNLEGVFDFYLTRMHQFVVFQDRDGGGLDMVDFRQYYDEPRRTHHPLSLPIGQLALLGMSHTLKTYMIDHLASLGVDPVSRQDITDSVLSLVYKAVAGHVREFRVAVDLEVATVEAVREVGELPRQGPRGATRAAIGRLNAASFLASEGEDLEVGPCAICLEDLSSGDGDRRLVRMPCGHVFHGSCLTRWLTTNSTCPLCRRELDD